MDRFPNQGNVMGAQGFSPGQLNMLPDQNALQYSLFQKMLQLKIKYTLFFGKNSSGVYNATYSSVEIAGLISGFITILGYHIAGVMSSLCVG